MSAARLRRGQAMADPIRFRDIRLEGGWLMVKPERQDMGKAMALVRKHKNRLYDLEIKEHRQKRSLDANAYCWVLIDRLATAMGIPPVEVYRGAIRDISGTYTPMCVRGKDVERIKASWGRNGLGWFVEDLGPSQVPGCRNLAAYHGSSVYDSRQMAALIDNIVQDCKALDIETLPPDKLALLKEAWQ